MAAPRREENTHESDRPVHAVFLVDGMAMSKAKRVVEQTGETYGVKFRGPGCGDFKVIPTGPASQGPKWGFNGDFERPTLTPSILQRTGHYATHHKPGDECWCTYNAEHPDELADFKCEVCHSFVTDGRIQFLGDCTHALAGQTVHLPELVERDDE
jgi:hypothetical protein